MRSFFLLLLALLVTPAEARLPYTDSRYAEEVPTLKEVLGHEPGSEITTPEEAVRYLKALAEAAPGRIQLTRYATSWQGRPLYYAVIGKPDILARANGIKANLARLSDGESVTGEARERMIGELPAVTWLAYSVHGNEISAADAGLALAYHLVAARGDEQVDEILSNTIVVIDPVQNPDGRARFVASFEAARGIEARGTRFAAERDEPWPSGRYNQALFDLNRDWFALTQPETRGKVAAIAEWNPVVVVDAHEMGSDSTYFFPPAARPFNPQLTENSREGQEIVGRANAAAFDKVGIPYFTREVYDNFYPGFGDMWPALRGAVAMTYEQASPRGLLYEPEDGDTLTYAKAVGHHFLATLTTAHTVARNKERFLRAYAQDRATAIEENREAGDRYTVIDLEERPGQARALARQLLAQSIEVMEAGPGTQLCGATYEEGALVVDKAQASGRLVRTLLDEDTPLPQDFAREQEERRKAGLGHELYDVTAWSLPLMAGLSSTVCGEIAADLLEPFSPAQDTAPLEEAAFGYALPWDDAEQARLLVAALSRGLDARMAGEGFSQNGRDFPRGTVVFAHRLNEGDLTETLQTLVSEHGGRLEPMGSSWVDAGPNIGSGSFRRLRLPKVAMAYGEGTSPLSAGSTRYVLERRLGLPVTPIRVLSLQRAALGEFDVLILPEIDRSFGRLSGGAEDVLGEFVEDGGVLVGFGSALQALGSEEAGLLPLVRERALEAEETDAGSASELASEDELREVTKSAAGYPDRVPGVLLNTLADDNSVLSAGYDGAVVLFRGDTIYAPVKEDEATTVFRYEEPEELLASGYLWDEVRRQLAYKPFLVSRREGDGMVVGFTQDPTTRGYLGGLDLMLANSLLFAPAATR